jgi:uncharacterized membrane protein YfcA
VASAYYLAAQNRPLFFVAVFIVAILSGATATVVGFGIGSLMRPLLAIKFGGLMYSKRERAITVVDRHKSSALSSVSVI